MTDTVENRDARQDQRRERSGCHGDRCRATGEEKIKPAQGKSIDPGDFEWSYNKRQFLRGLF